MPKALPDANTRGNICGRVLESAWATLFVPPARNYTPPPHCTPDGGCPGGLCAFELKAERRASRHVLTYAVGGVALLYCVACLVHRRERLVRGARAFVRIALLEP